MQLKATGRGKILRFERPSLRKSLRTSSSNSARARPPAPLIAWYVETTIRRMRAASWSGLSATTIWIVEQFGLATIPLCFDASDAFTSGTTRGVPGSLRQALQLSMTNAPLLAKIGGNPRLLEEPAL